MPKPHKNTIDALVNQFDSWDCDTQERVLDQLELVQRLAKRRAVRKPEAEPEPVQAQLPGGVN